MLLEGESSNILNFTWGRLVIYNSLLYWICPCWICQCFSKLPLVNKKRGGRGEGEPQCATINYSPPKLPRSGVTFHCLSYIKKPSLCYSDGDTCPWSEYRTSLWTVGFWKGRRGGCSSRLWYGICKGKVKYKISLLLQVGYLLSQKWDPDL